MGLLFRETVTLADDRAFDIGVGAIVPGPGASRAIREPIQRQRVSTPRSALGGGIFGLLERAW